MDFFSVINADNVVSLISALFSGLATLMGGIALLKTKGLKEKIKSLETALLIERETVDRLNNRVKEMRKEIDDLLKKLKDKDGLIDVLKKKLNK